MHNPRNEFSSTVDYRNGSYGNWGTNDFGRNLAQNYENQRNWNNQGVQFRPNQGMEEDDSGVLSPPLWKRSPSPPKSPSQPLLHHQNYRVYSPNSRAQAIARGQWELMEMVKNMPESSYELSLKDLVEHHRIETQDQEERLNKERKNGIQGLNQRGKVKRQESKKNEKIVRNGSFDNRGLFLKMGFPISLKSKKKKNIVNNSGGKVSPKPEGSTDKDWWMKRFAGSTDSGSSGSVSGSGSSGRSYSARYFEFVIHIFMDSNEMVQD
ncbi:embryo defective [Abeliophyllum distichum]|uniref:Embryo defective n=1 Tax=Abeliophyllum distichum TaxID=126358 RepID=A0ABD1SU06_9LAMI